MSLTRFYPCPSDRMGILWALLQIDDLIVLEYGTSGTTAYAAKLLASMGHDISQRLFTTEMSESEVVMGDTSRLEDKIRKLDELYQPRAIVVMASSVSAVTGTDVKGVRHYMADEIQAKLICFGHVGFGDDYSQGLASANHLLVEQFAIQEHERTPTFNILGACPLSHFTAHELDDITQNIQEQFNLALHTALPWQSRLAEIESMSQAKINIVLSAYALPAAQLLEERFATPYVYALPLGDSGLSHLHQQIENKLQIKAKDAPTLITQLKDPRTVIIYAEYDRCLALYNLMSAWGVNEITAISRTQLPTNHATSISAPPSEKEIIKIFLNAHNFVILADGLIAKEYLSSNNSLLCASSTLFDPLPRYTSLIGAKGAKLLKEALKL